MSMNLIAMLVSLAMMLTGLGGAAQPAVETARTLTLSNLNVTWNGEALRLEPQAHIGVSTDGTKAVYDFAVELGDKKLMPVQVVAGESGITALSGNSGIAVNVTAEALATLAEQLEAQMNASLAEAGGDNAQLMQFITEEYMPAYTGMLKLAMDPAQREKVNAAAQKVFDRVVDRGQGTPSALDVDGDSYNVTAYSYSLDALQLAALSDAMYTEIPEMNDYYNALFKLYGMLPEESGLRGVDSLTALFERFGVQMQMDVEEQRTADGAVDVMDSVLTVDLNSMANAAVIPVAPAEAQSEVVPEGEDQLEGAPLETAVEDKAEDAVPEVEAADVAENQTADFETDVAGKSEGQMTSASSGEPNTDADVAEVEAAPGLAPLVMNAHSVKLLDYSESTGDCTYAIDARHSVEFSLTASESEGVQELEMKVILTEDGEKTQGGKLSAFIAYDEMGTVSYSMSMKGIQQDTAKLDAAVYGVENPDGTSENSVAFELRAGGENVAISFDLNVTADAIEDAASAAKPACVIDDLSQEGLQTLMQDPAVVGTLMQAAGAMLADVNTLKADPSVKSLGALMRGNGLPIDVDELDEADYEFEPDFDGMPEGDDEAYGLVIGDDGDYQLVVGEGNETAFDADDMPVQDDGVLAFEQPRLNWLPSGWKVTDIETDTAYDWVQMTILDADGAECAYAIFFLDPEADTANYIVQDDGAVVDGRMMNVTDFGEGGLSVTVSENGMYGNLMFNSEAIELDTIGKIVAGIEF